MSQIIGYLSEKACYICVDSNIVYPDKSTSLSNKLFISKHFIIATAGLSFGMDILEGLMEKSRTLDIKSFEEIEEYLMTIGNNQYKNFINNFERTLKKEFMRVYFVFSGRKTTGELKIGLLGAEDKEDFKRIEIKNLITAPRRLGIEMAMMNLKDQNENDLKNFFKKAMEKISIIDKNVSPPFRLGIINKNGKTDYKLL
ncbi:MAG: hypothetical protein N2202_07240 [Proteobacteria bacterium]|nr:hypothetical protein [Pseudomonadota bacterium]